jgi:hypothetical protein
MNQTKANIQGQSWSGFHAMKRNDWPYTGHVCAHGFEEAGVYDSMVIWRLGKG